MSQSTQKYILITSLVWACILGVVLFFLHNSQHRTPTNTGAPAPLAEGPAVSSRATSQTPQSPQQVEAPLAPVQLSQAQMQSIDMSTGMVQYKQLDNDLSATGTVAINDRLVSYVQTRFSGYIRKVFVNATYQYVRKGQPLFTIYSPDLVATEQEYLLARANQKTLGTSSIGDVAADANSLTSAAEQRLAQWDISANQIADLKRTGRALPDLTINAPASGYVTEFNALPNLYATPATRLYTIADLSRVWVNAKVFQPDVGQLRPDDFANITVDAYPLKTFRGRVEQILPQVDMATRTVAVRLSIANPGLLLKPGMFVNVELKSPMGRRLVVPASAVFQTGTRQVVFLDHGNGSIEPHDVVLGSRIGDDSVVLKGLTPGESIVTSANFLIDSESQLQAAAGVYTPPPPGAGANQASPVQQTQIDLTTDPNPPRKGANVFQVKLTGSNDAAIAGADVTVTFFMPAMPAMGMAAMNTSVHLAEKSGGVYEGSGKLGSGGTWQVTVVAKKNGTVLATKQVHLNATGGM
jgi:RND family efflux transporter MFP subunit